MLSATLARAQGGVAEAETLEQQGEQKAKAGRPGEAEPFLRRALLQRAFLQRALLQRALAICERTWLIGISAKLRRRLGSYTTSGGANRRRAGWPKGKSDCGRSRLLGRLGAQTSID